MHSPDVKTPALIIWTLGLSQIIGYGTLYYSFAILAEDAAHSFSWPVAWLYGSFSVALLVGGLVAPEVGRRIDRHGAGKVMAAGSLLSAAALLAMAFAPDGMTFTVAIIAMEITATLVLYDAAFAALVQLSGQDAHRHITHLTLIAGFASTIFWPLTARLHETLDWRQIYIGFALANLVVCFPIHLLIASRHVRAKRQTAAMPASVQAPDVPLPLRQRRLLWLATWGFALSGFALSAILATMVPLLTALGLGTSALIVSTLFGPAQVLIRFLNMLVGVRRHPIVGTLVAVGLIPLAITLVAVSAPWAVGAGVFAVLLGFGSGLKSIVQGTLPLALFGTSSYGARLRGNGSGAPGAGSDRAIRPCFHDRGVWSGFLALCTRDDRAGWTGVHDRSCKINCVLLLLNKCVDLCAPLDDYADVSIA